MPRVAFESEVAKEREWAVAVSLLNGAPEGTKIKRAVKKQPRAYRHPDDGSQVYLQHSFITINGKILCMTGEGERLGEGTFGIVKLAEDADGNQYALKTSKSNQSTDNDAEARALYDLGVLQGVVKSPRPDSRVKHVTAMKYLGKSLKAHLRDTESLETKDQFDIAIKVLDCIYRLHEGFTSSKGIKRAHLDIKPENLCIDDDGNISLIDYGFSAELPASTAHPGKGTPRYVPAYAAHKSEKYELYDAFAAQRVLWLPKKYHMLNAATGQAIIEKKDAKDAYDICVFKKPLNFLDTSSGRLNRYSIPEMFALVVLEKHKIRTSTNTKKVLQDPKLFYARYKALAQSGEPKLPDLQKIIQGVAPAIPPRQATQKYERYDSDSDISVDKSSSSSSSSSSASSGQPPTPPVRAESLAQPKPVPRKGLELRKDGVSKLEQYCASRSKYEGSPAHRINALRKKVLGHPALPKISAAQRLIELLKNPHGCVQFTKAELQAITHKKSKLSELVKNIFGDNDLGGNPFGYRVLRAFTYNPNEGPETKFNVSVYYNAQDRQLRFKCELAQNAPTATPFAQQYLAKHTAPHADASTPSP
jgi:serine/threonine protein kinase